MEALNVMNYDKKIFIFLMFLNIDKRVYKISQSSKKKICAFQPLYYMNWK